MHKICELLHMQLFHYLLLCGFEYCIVLSGYTTCDAYTSTSYDNITCVRLYSSYSEKKYMQLHISASMICNVAIKIFPNCSLSVYLTIYVIMLRHMYY